MAAIAARLEDSDSNAREAAVGALKGLGEHAAPHTAAIAARLENSDWNVRHAAMRALSGLGEHAAPHMAAIAARLEDSDSYVRERGGSGCAVGAWGARSTAHGGDRGTAGGQR